MERKDFIEFMWGVFAFIFVSGFVFCGANYVIEGDIAPMLRFILLAVIALVFWASANLAILGLWKRGK